MTTLLFAIFPSCTPDATIARERSLPDTQSTDSGSPIRTDTATIATGDTGATVLPRPCGVLQSAALIGGTMVSTQSLGIDPAGGLSAGGAFGETLTLGAGGPAETTLSGDGGLILHYAPDGSFAWARTLSSLAWPSALAGTNDGGVVVIGSFYEEITVAVGEPDAITFTSFGEADGYVSRFGSDGSLSWAVHLGSALHVFPLGLGLLADDSVVVTGIYRSDLRLGIGEPSETTLPVYPGSNESGIVARFDADGVLLWATRFGGTTFARADAADVDSVTQELVIGGIISGEGVAEFPATPPIIIDPIAATGFLARFDADGNARSLTTFGGSPETLDVAADGSVVVGGEFDDTVIFGAGEANETTLSTVANTDAFVARFDSNGALSWAAQSLTPLHANTFGRAVGAMNDGTALLVGTFTANVGFDYNGPNATLLSTSDSTDSYVAQFDPTGAFVCATHIAGIEGNLTTDLLVRPDETFVITGDLSGPTRFAADTPEELELTPSGTVDGFLATFAF